MRKFRVFFSLIKKKYFFNLKADKKLTDALWMFLINFIASKEEKKVLLKTFKALDKNGDG